MQWLGLLGPDLDDSAEAALRQVAERRPHLLAEVVESPRAVISQAKHQPDLLLALTEAYYIERPATGRSPFAMTLMDDDIRRHTSTGIGFPFAGWYVGPFHMLLRVRPLETLALINRMLDHAAKLTAQRSENPTVGTDKTGLHCAGSWVSLRRNASDVLRGRGAPVVLDDHSIADDFACVVTDVGLVERVPDVDARRGEVSEVHYGHEVEVALEMAGIVPPCQREQFRDGT